MKVYLIKREVNTFRSVLFSRSQDIGAPLYSFDGTPAAESWAPLKVYCDNPKKKRGDFWDVGVGLTFAATAQALELVRTPFEMAGELLSLEFAARRGPSVVEPLTVLNVTSVVDCLDHDRCTFMTFDDGVTVLESEAPLIFNPSRFDEPSIFKVPETAASDIYCREDDGDSELEFKAAVEKHGLTGLRFVQVWEG